MTRELVQAPFQMWFVRLFEFVRHRGDAKQEREWVWELPRLTLGRIMLQNKGQTPENAQPLLVTAGNARDGTQQRPIPGLKCRVMLGTGHRPLKLPPGVSESVSDTFTPV